MKLNRTLYTDFEDHPVKVLQFGKGNFLRGFVDWMIDEMNEKIGFNACVDTIQPISHGIAEKLNQQDGLYTLYLKGIKNGEPVSEHRVITCIKRGVNPFTDYDEYRELAGNPDIRFIVSNTTEAGIAFNHEEMVEGRPQMTFPAKLTYLLYTRYKTFEGAPDKGCIFLPCELIEKNGDKLRQCVLAYAELWNLGEEFITWITEHNIFCNTLVDRIVPGYPKDRIDEITAELGYEDDLVVVGEQFHLWVIEGPEQVRKEFPADKAGLNVKFVEDLTSYRTRKVRILNGAHTSMMAVAYMSGIDTVRDAVMDEQVGSFIKGAIFDEIILTLDLPDEELSSFASEVLDRFRNPFIKHYLLNISLNSFSKFETRVLPSIVEYRERTGKLPKRLVFSLAALIAFYQGIRDGEHFEIKDNEDVLSLFNYLWDMADTSEINLRFIATTVLAYEMNWKMNLNDIDGFREMLSDYLILIERKGMRDALKEVLA